MLANLFRVIVPVVSFSAVVQAESHSWSSPHAYEGKPSHPYEPRGWQQYFEVVEPLPNVTWPSPRSYAGSMSSETHKMPNNSLFFWAAEKDNGSITSVNSSDPWMIYLAGGPGYSSLASALSENIGPYIMTETGVGPNNYSWHKFVDLFFVDSPVGTGYSTSGQGGNADDQERVASDFLSFLGNLVKVFPGLQKRPLYIIGESYAGRFIPYILKSYFGMEESSRNFKIGKAGCSNPALLDAAVFENIPILQVVETYPQLISYNASVYDYIREQHHLCKFDLNLTYPQEGGKYPSPEVRYGSIDDRVHGLTRRNIKDSPAAVIPHKATLRHGRLHTQSATTRRSDSNGSSFDVTLTGTVNAFYGCDLRDLVLEYALNYTYPWTEIKTTQFDVTDVPYIKSPRAGHEHPRHWMNHDDTRRAIHAPQNKVWDSSIQYEWRNHDGTDPSPPSIDFMDDLMANATKENVGILWFSGNDDSLSAHFSTEVAIQNTTWGGIQGFTSRPNTSWYDDSGNFGGIVHEERGLMYALIYGAGHQVNTVHPERIFAFVRDFFVGNTKMGVMNATSNDAVGSQDREAPQPLADGVLPGQAEIIYGSTTIVWPSATIDAFNQHLESVLKAQAPTALPSSVSPPAAILN